MSNATNNGALRSAAENESSKAAVDKAKFMYMSNIPTPEISELTGLSVDRVNTLIYGANGKGDSQYCWFKQKETGHLSSISYFIRNKVEVLESTAGMALDLLVNGLKVIKKDVDAGKQKLSVRELKTLAEVVGDVHKIVQLEQGKPTQIFSQAGLSAKDAREILKNDPFSLGIVPTESITLDKFDPLKEEDNGSGSEVQSTK